MLTHSSLTLQVFEVKGISQFSMDMQESTLQSGAVSTFMRYAHIRDVQNNITNI